jgi:phage repressor protein C with HTH and peptisase S24 domain
MIPRYNPGEFALVEPGTAPDLEDDVLVRLRSGQTMIKRLLSKRAGWRFGSYNNSEILHYGVEDVTWVYYVAHPVPRRKIKSRC